MAADFACVDIAMLCGGWCSVNRMSGSCVHCAAIPDGYGLICRAALTKLKNNECAEPCVSSWKHSDFVIAVARELDLNVTALSNIPDVVCAVESKIFL